MASDFLTAAQCERFLDRVRILSDEECWEWQGWTDERGYGRVSVGNRKLQVHRLAYEWQYGPIASGLYVCHDCDNPRCCNPLHLTADTQKYNMHGASQRGRISFGSLHPNCSFRKEQVQSICRALAAGITQSDIAAHYSVSQQTIAQILHGKAYKWLDKELNAEEQSELEALRKRGNHLSRHGTASKLTETQVAEIRGRLAEGSISQAAIAAHYGVAQGTISRIVLGKYWPSPDVTAYQKLKEEMLKELPPDPKQRVGFTPEMVGEMVRVTVGKRVLFALIEAVEPDGRASLLGFDPGGPLPLRGG